MIETALLELPVSDNKPKDLYIEGFEYHFKMDEYKTDKLRFLYRTLDDEIVKDGLSSIGALSNREESKGLCMIVGGIAAQSYLPTKYRRTTSDIDVLVGKPLNYEDFKNFSKPIRECLSDLGYEVKSKKGSRAYHLEITSKEGDGLLLEFSRRNQNNFSKVEKRIKRELENSRSKRVEEREVNYAVSSPEDIVLPKLVRGVGSLYRNPGFEKYLTQLERSLSDEDIEKQLKKIQEKREEAIYNVGDVKLAEEMRFMGDLYDVWILSEIAGFNENYLREGTKDWDRITENSKESKKIKSLLPNLL